MTSTTHVLYLHGFRSSPESAKAQLMAKWLAREHPGVYWACPHLPVSPMEAAEVTRHILKDWPAQSSTVIGSSLGGLYATWAAADRLSAQALVDPERLLAVIAKGDELLNWRKMYARYAYAQTHVLEESDHGRYPLQSA